ncbi:MAG: hypothetical protein IPM79_15495 [Polyangiaceae bacterium]|nr:hypothetical protein [Polyangiaceae bacterium]
MAFWLRDARVFAEALFADAGGPPPSNRIDWLMRELEDFVEQAGPRVRAILVGGLLVASWAAPPLAGRAPPLSRLSLADRVRALDALEHTPAGLPLLAVKAILSILYYEHPEALRDAGVIGPSDEGLSCLS